MPSLIVCRAAAAAGRLPVTAALPHSVPASGYASKGRVAGVRQASRSSKARLQSAPPAARSWIEAAALPHSAAGEQVAAFFEAFNQRSVPAMLGCLSPDPVYHNLGYPEPFRGRQAVEAVLSSLVSGAPPSWRLVVDDATGDGASAAVVYHMRDDGGRVVPLSSGLAFYRLDEAGRICSIVESSEQVFKVPRAVLPALGAAAPLLQALSAGPLGGLLPAMPPASAAPASFFPAGAAGGGGSPAWPSRRPAASSSAALSSPPPRPLPAPAPPAQPTPAPSSSSSSSSAAAAQGSGGDGDGGGDGIAALVGVWIRDASASDAASYARACDLMQLSGLQKTTATQLIEGLELELRGGRLAVRFLTVVPFFKVTEEYALDGPASMPRRDLRRGSQRASATPAPGGSLEVRIEWDEPNAGGIREVYRLLDSGTLECQSTVTVAAGAVTTRTVYRRSAGWRPRFAWNPLLGPVSS